MSTTEAEAVVLPHAVDPVSLLGRVAELEDKVVQLEQALVTRQQIGVATGLLAERYALTPDTAWAVLTRVSQNANVRLRDVARIIHDASADALPAGDHALAARLHDHLSAVVHGPARHGRPRTGGRRSPAHRDRDAR